MKKKSIDWTAILLILSVLVVLSAYTNTNVLLGDSQGYAVLANNLITYNSYTLDGITPHVQWTWGFPIYLVPFVAIFGEINGMIIGNIFAGLLLAILSFIFFRLFFNKILSAILTLLLVSSPFVFFFIKNPHSEILFTSVILGIAIILFKYYKTHKLISSMIIAVLIGITANIRAPGVFVLLPVIFYMYMSDRSQYKIKDSHAKKISNRKDRLLNKLKTDYSCFLRYAIVIVIALAISSIWYIRNYIVSKSVTSYLDVSSSLGFNYSFSAIYNNIIYYFNPIHTVFPVLFIFVILGLFVIFRVFCYGKKDSRAAKISPSDFDGPMTFTLLLFIFSLMSFYFFWAYHSYRFFVPIIPFVLVVAGMGINYAYARYKAVTVVFLVLGVVISTFFLAIFSYGSIYDFTEKIGLNPFPEDSNWFCQYQNNLDSLVKEQPQVFHGNSTVFMLGTNTMFGAQGIDFSSLVWSKDKDRFGDVRLVDKLQDAEYVVVVSPEQAKDYDFSRGYSVVALKNNPSIIIYRKN